MPNLSSFLSPLVLLTAIGLGACSNQNQANAADTKIQNTQAPKAQSTQTTDNIATGDTATIAKQLQANLQTAGIDAQIKAVYPTDMPNMYLAQVSNMPPVFTDSTGTYIFQGDIIKLDGNKPVNIGAGIQKTIAKQALASVDSKDMIIFKPKGETKAAIYVFTDPTCYYCQLLHKDIDDVLAQGIEVRYLAWPRNEQTIPMVESVWCQSDRHSALTQAKLGNPPTPKTCDNPVQAQIALGFSLGITGTPAIFAENGEQIGGYLPAKELAKVAINNK